MNRSDRGRYIAIEPSEKTYTLLGRDGKPYTSTTPGTLGGHRARKGYGRLDCRSALRWIEKGYYVRHRVFFADEETAIAAGYRPCAVCLPEAYAAWKAKRTESSRVLDMETSLHVDVDDGVQSLGV